MSIIWRRSVRTISTMSHGDCLLMKLLRMCGARVVRSFESRNKEHALWPSVCLIPGIMEILHWQWGWEHGNITKPHPCLGLAYGWWFPLLVKRASSSVIRQARWDTEVRLSSPSANCPAKWGSVLDWSPTALQSNWIPKPQLQNVQKPRMSNWKNIFFIVHPTTGICKLGYAAM